jgi:hypothetical protein
LRERSGLREKLRSQSDGAVHLTDSTSYIGVTKGPHVLTDQWGKKMEKKIEKWYDTARGDSTAKNITLRKNKRLQVHNYSRHDKLSWVAQDHTELHQSRLTCIPSVCWTTNP